MMSRLVGTAWGVSMNILKELPPQAKPGELVSIDTEFFNQTDGKLHRPHGDFADITVCMERDEDTVYLVQDQSDIRKTLKALDKGEWVMSNSIYDITQLRRFADIQPRYIYDTELVERCAYGGLYDTFSLKDQARRWLDVYMEKETRDQFASSREMSPKMEKYAALDAHYTMKIARTQREYLGGTRAMDAYNLIDEPAIWPTLDLQPMKVDVAQWEKNVQGYIARAREIEDEIGVNSMSPQQVKREAAKHGLRLKDTAALTLEEYKSNPFIAGVLEARKYRKAVSTYGMSWLEKYVEEGDLVYASYRVTGAETGRRSCVSGTTLLHTNRGTFRFDEYEPRDGDLVPTHTGEWKPVLRKIFKGYDEMLSVYLSNGNVLQCTGDHRVLTPQGWERIANLPVGAEVYSYVSVEELCLQQREYRESAEFIFGGRAQAHIARNSGRVVCHISECKMDSSGTRGLGEKEIGERYPSVQIKDGKEKSHARKEWRGAFKLQRIGIGRIWLCPIEGEWEIRSGTSKSNGGGFRTGRVTDLVRCSSYRRGQTKQRSGQFGAGYKIGAHETAREVAKISEVTSLGTMGVWDIEVAENHSYVTGGFINHNSQNPNMQQIPARKMPEYRDLFFSKYGRLIVADASQQEPCVLGFYSQDPALLAAIRAGEDLHQTVADAIQRDRKTGKIINLATSYGMTAKGLSRKLNIPESEAEALLTAYFMRFKGVLAWIGSQRSSAYKLGYVTTVSGRPVYINPHDYQWSNNAINAPVQGGAGDFNKMWERLLWEACRAEDIPYSVCGLIHDEVVTDPPKEVYKLTRKLKEESFHQAAKRLFKDIPFRLDMKSGKKWSCKELEDEEEYDEAD